MIDDTTAKPHQPRRRLLQAAAGSALAGIAGAPRAVAAADVFTQPFDNGQRALAAFPQKRPMIVLTTRPPQLETPFEIFGQGPITPNDAFFVRYHLSGIPTAVDAADYRLAVTGKVNKPLSLSLSELKALGEPVEVVAVNQCSGNSRAFFSPRVNGGQLGNGAMGNARWTGIALKRVLEAAGVQAGAVQVSFDGLDRPVLDETPDFVKALPLDQALDGEVMIAWGMNGQDLPMLNGYPIRLVVPGYYGTYWIKHLSEIKVLDAPFTGFWMASAYRIPDNACSCTEPGTPAAKTVPINRMNVRSFITSVREGERLPVGREQVIKGIAFDGGQGIREVAFSADGGQSWRAASLGADLGRFGFREWSIAFRPATKGDFDLRVRAVNRAGQSQPLEALWNPPGYMRNVVETVRVTAA